MSACGRRPKFDILRSDARGCTERREDHDLTFGANRVQSDEVPDLVFATVSVRHWTTNATPSEGALGVRRTQRFLLAMLGGCGPFEAPHQLAVRHLHDEHTVVFYLLR